MVFLLLFATWAPSLAGIFSSTIPKHPNSSKKMCIFYQFVSFFLFSSTNHVCTELMNRLRSKTKVPHNWYASTKNSNYRFLNFWTPSSFTAPAPVSFIMRIAEFSASREFPGKYQKVNPQLQAHGLLPYYWSSMINHWSSVIGNVVSWPAMTFEAESPTRWYLFQRYLLSVP